MQKQLNIQPCARCASCGYVTGYMRNDWEIPWTTWVAGSTDPENDPRVAMLRPRPCADCGGTGALVEGTETETQPVRSRVPLRSIQMNRYAERVTGLLGQSRARAAFAR